MKVIVKKKVYNGMAELRDYEVDRFVKYKQTVKIVIGDEYMILTPSELRKGRITNTQHSIYDPNQTYKLVGYRWHPKKEIVHEQLSIDTTVMQRLGELFKKKYANT